MRKRFFISICIFSLAAGGSSPAFGQVAVRADQMVVNEQDSMPDTPGIEAANGAALETAAGELVVTNPYAADFEAADPVERIWDEIENSGNGMDRTDAGKSLNPWSFSTSVGTSFITFPRFGSAMNMYAAPQVNFAATERLGLHAGVSVGRTLPVTGLNTEENMVNTGISNISTYIAASYLLTENLVIHGSGSRNIYMMPVYGEMQTVHFNDLSFGATYNFGNFSIGATIHHSDAPMFGSPFGSGSSMYGTPFYW